MFRLPTLENRKSASPKAEQHTMCFVVCYIGKPPAGLELFFKSCAQNSDVHFLIFADQIEQAMAPPNVTVIKTTLPALAQLASKTIGFEVSLNNPYKLCDYKVAYGAMFADYLESYEFWGTTDLDVIFGDISAFITPEVMNNYDVINGHQDYIVGHFTLYRNAPLLNTMFKQSKDYKQIYQTPQCMSFGECGGHWHEYRIRKNTRYTHRKMDSTMHVVERLAGQGKLRTYFQPLVREREHLHKTQWLLYWDNGRLFDIKENVEIMYFHFHLLGQQFEIPYWPNPPDKFYINRHGFFV